MVLDIIQYNLNISIARIIGRIAFFIVMDFLELAKTLKVSVFRANVTLLKYPHPAPWEQYPNWVISELVRGEVVIELMTGEKVTAGPGNVLFIPPTVTHRSVLSKGVDILARWSHVNFTVLQNINISEFLTVPVVTGDRAFANEIGKINERLAGLLKRLAESKDLAAAAELQQTGFSLLCKMIETGAFNSDHPLLAEEGQRILPALQYIEENLAKPVQREKLAELCNLSAPRFHVVFTELMKTTPMRYVRTRRCQCAQELLAGTDLPISEIAQLVGYEDQYIFSRAFKSTTGNSPSTARQNYRDMLNT